LYVCAVFIFQAKAIATQCQASFISVKGPELLSSYLGESEKAMRDLFARARSNSPCVLFFDEIDSIAQTRSASGHSDATCDRVLNQMLTEMDSRATIVRQDNQSKSDHSPVVFVVAATNRPELLDPALLRPGRFDQLLFVGLPSVSSRLSILQTLLSHTPVDPAVDSSYLSSLADRTTRLSGADLANLVNRARSLAINAHIKAATSAAVSPSKVAHADDGTDVVKVSYFEAALASVKPSVSDEVQPKQLRKNNTLATEAVYCKTQATPHLPS